MRNLYGSVLGQRWRFAKVCGLWEFHFGRLDRAELTVRFFAPTWRRWDLSRWLGRDWAFEFWSHRWCNHRCYCPGTLFDGRLFVAGFGVVWFFSVYRGPVPCPCDIAVAEMFPEDE